jgi:hypothetical protein
LKTDGYCVLGVDRENDLGADTLLEAMDRAQVDRAAIAPVDRRLRSKQNRRHPECGFYFFVRFSRLTCRFLAGKKLCHILMNCEAELPLRLDCPSRRDCRGKDRGGGL